MKRPLLEKIERRWTSSYQNATSDGKTKYIKFASENEGKILSFISKVDKTEI